MATPAAGPDLTPEQRRSFRASLIWVAVIVVVIVALQLPLPDVVTIGPTWLVPFIELAGIPIVALLYLVAGERKRLVTGTMTAFLVFLVLASVMNAVLLLINLVNGFTESGAALLFAGFAVLIVNVLSFGIVYWWIDAGGPLARMQGRTTKKDFLFPQQGMDDMEGWQPALLDYLFTAYTNIIAFSPTDTMPLSHRVKALFVVQSSTAVVTIVVTLSRAINLIPGATPGS
jgi:predicted nucleic acid-binding Zn ribbon protein